MLDIQDHGARLCDGLSRRDWLKIGGLGIAGLSLPAAKTPLGARPPSYGAGRSWRPKVSAGST